MGDAALIPLRMFRIRPVAVAIAASVVIGMAMFGGILRAPALHADRARRLAR